jgi:hypothetical protein
MSHEGYYVDDTYARENRIPRYCPTCGALHPDDASVADGNPVVGHVEGCTELGPAYGNAGDVEYGLTGNNEEHAMTVLVAVKVPNDLEPLVEDQLTSAIQELVQEGLDRFVELL